MSDAPQANMLVPLMLFGWPLVLLALFLVLPSRRATIAAFLFAWLFLPVAEYNIVGLPDWNKMSATSIGIFVATILFDPTRIVQLRPRWIDAAMLLLCICPFFSSITNNLGVYDGLSSVFRQIVRWGLPYIVGRMYFSDVEGMRELMIGVFIGGLIYAPLCWFEIRFSPQLHRIFYGYHQHGFGQTIRYGGYRPMVFMEHGLMVGMWMVSAALSGLALWRSGTLRHLFGFPTWPMVAVLLLTALLCKSTGAIGVLFIGLGALAVIYYLRVNVAIPAIAFVSVAYILLRASGLWSGEQLVDYANLIVGEERAGSLETRIRNENLLGARAREQWLFGWGGWNRSRITDAAGRDISITDSQWIITFGVTGVVGLLGLFGSILFPALVLSWRAHPFTWAHAAVIPYALAALLLALWMVDNTVNAMFNPIYLLMAGGLAGMTPIVFVRA
ncbi:MAG: O-antigen ligase domain-containing protein, partial [Candidatus Hydrogenedentes bacterium]|nr:O-antigen ligase domain-containing protein [Candidatus Hydrogenedentota bacterium]